jgi:hypothetical protein
LRILKYANATIRGGECFTCCPHDDPKHDMQTDLITDALPPTERFRDRSGETRGKMSTRADASLLHASEVRSVTTSLYHLEQSFDPCTTSAPHGMIVSY